MPNDTTITPSDPDSLADAVATTAFLAEHAVRENVKSPPEDLFTGAHGDLIFVKICAALADAPTVVKIQALQRVRDLTRKAENIPIAIEKGVFQELNLNLGDWDPDVRRLSAESIVFVTDTQAGRMHTLEEDIMSTFAKLLNDADTGVKLSGYKIFSNLALTASGLEAIIDFNLIDKFILKILQEKDDAVKVKCLEVLGQCIRFESGIGYQKAMEANVVSTLKVALGGSKNQPALEAAICKVFSYIAYNSDGKDKIVEVGTVPLILALLRSENNTVRIAATGCLTFITVSLAGKVAVVEEDMGVESLIAGCAHKNDYIASNSMQALANVAGNARALADLNCI